MKKLILFLLLSSSGLFGQATTAPSTTNAVPYYSDPGTVKGVAGPTSPAGVPQVLTSTPPGGGVAGIPTWLPATSLPLLTAIQVAPATLTFPGTAVGASTPSQTVTVTNTGTPVIAFSGIAVTGDFSQTNNCATLAQSTSCSVLVTFSPTTSGTRTGILSVFDNVTGSPQTVSLSGTGLSSPTWSSLSITPASPTIVLPGTLPLSISATPSSGPSVNVTSSVNYSASGGGSTPWKCVTGALPACTNNVSGYTTAWNTTGSKTLVATNTSGNLLVVMIGSYSSGGSQTLSVSDTNSDSFSHVGPLTGVSGTRVNDLYYAKLNASGSNTITCGASAGYFQCTAVELSGNASSVFDTFATGTGSSLSMSTATMTTAGTYDSIVGFCTDNGASTGTMAGGGGYTVLSQTTTYPSMSEYQFGLAAGTYSVSGTDTGTPDNWLCIGAAFKGGGSSSFASVNPGGLVTGLAAGTSTITAQGGKLTSNRNSLASSGSTTATTVIFPQNQTAGNTNVVAIGWTTATGTVSSVTDAAGNIYTAAGAISAGHGASSVIYLATAIEPYAVPTGNSITVTMGQSTTGLSVAIGEYSLTPASPVQDGAVVDSNGASGPAAGTLTTSNANDEVVCAVMPAAGLVQTTGAPFAIEILGSIGFSIIDTPVFAAGSVSASSVLSGGGYAQQCVALEAVAATDSITIASQAVSNVYYIAPSNATPPGNDSNPGTQSAPFLSFTHTFAVTNANCPGSNGCVLYLENGTYQPATGTGFLNMNCATGGNLPNGTSSAPMILTTLNQRQAHIVSDGTPSVGPVQMSNCSYWTISGIHVTDADSLSESSEDATLAVVGGSHDQLLYNLVDHTNRCENEHGIGFFYGVSNSLAQDNEVYYFHRHAYLDFSNSNGSGAGNEFSRNYANSRNYAAPLACYPFTGGANAFMSYGGSYTLWENNIDDETTGNQVTTGYEVEVITGQPGVTNDTFLGNVGYQMEEGFAGQPHTSNSGQGISNTTYTNDVVINPILIGDFFRCMFATVVNNESVFSATATDANVTQDNNGGLCPTGAIAATITDTEIVTGLTAVGYEATNGGFTNDYTGAFGASSYSSGSVTSTHQFNTNPVFGNCFMWVPTASPAKSAGLAGADIGADVLYEYNSGTLGSTALWSTAAQCKIIGGVQQADCPVGAGALVAGLNDQAGASYGDVGNRLNVNKAGCGYPTGYTPAP